MNVVSAYDNQALSNMLQTSKDAYDKPALSNMHYTSKDTYDKPALSNLSNQSKDTLVNQMLTKMANIFINLCIIINRIPQIFWNIQATVDLYIYLALFTSWCFNQRCCFFLTLTENDKLVTTVCHIQRYLAFRGGT